MSDALSRFNDYLGESMGFEFPRIRWNDLKSKTEAAAAAFGFSDLETFVEHLVSTPATPDRTQRIANLLTNGETYFWREPLIFDALASRILPDLIRSREAGDRSLRIWSAGCSSGEEPYSIAIALRAAIPDLERWRVSILATDINADALRKASIGIYGEWSFRNAPAGFAERNFRALKDGRKEILPEIRQMISFSLLNLAENVFPSPSNGTLAMDIIFCRNVLMYFSPARAAAVGRRLYDCLSENGWLLVSASELSQTLFPRFRSVRINDAFAYRKTQENVDDNPESPVFAFPSVVIEPPRDIAKPPRPPTEPRPPPEPRYEIPPTPRLARPTAGEAKDRTSEVRALADLGRLDDALVLCERALVEEKLDAGLHYLRAAILQESGRLDDAARSLEKALYIDPEFVLAHYALGVIAIRNDDPKKGLRCFKNALECLSRLDDAASLPESGELTVCRFKEIVRSAMRMESKA